MNSTLFSSTLTVDREGYQLQVKVDGQGTPLLIIGSARYYDRAIPQTLRQHFQCIFIDHRGFASSNHPPKANDISLKIISEDIEYIRQILGINQAMIMGHSGHAYMALDYAKRYPAHITKVVLCGASPNLSPDSHQAAERYWESNADELRKALFETDIGLLGSDIQSDPERKFIHICCRLRARRWADHAYDESWLWQGLTAHSALFDKMWGDVFANIDIEQYTSAIEVPVLILMGQKDFSIARPSEWLSLSRPFARQTLHIFEQSGHTPPLEEPERFTQILRAWA